MELPRSDWYFHRKSTRWRWLGVLVALNLVGFWVLNQALAGELTYEDIFRPTPTPTRSPVSWAAEAEAHFEAGDLEAAIEAYRQAVAIAPDDARLWASMARVQTYSSMSLTTDTERYQRLQEAVASARRAVEVDDESSFAHAVLAFALDWLATNPLTTAEERDELLRQAENASARALLLNPDSGLALAYYAEVLLDQQRWIQAEEQAIKAVERSPNEMDPHRVYAYVLESLGRYREAIEQYLAAIRIAPNLTFLYLHVGFNYRYLAGRAESPAARERLYELALEYFDRAVSINQRLGIQDPVPYLAIAKTYTQQGEFFIAALNAERALLIDPTDTQTYAQLGVIYVKARNYEGSLPLFKCVVEGCSPEETEEILDTIADKFGMDPETVSGVQVDPLPLTNLTIAFYYTQYGAVLAALNMCDQAEPVFRRVEARYPNDPVLADIIQESRNICRILAAKEKGTPPPIPEPMYTPTP